jgi:hypothetical protein
MNRAIPSGIVPDMPRNWTSTFVEFSRMKMISRISSRSATAVATQAALARVIRGARRADEVPFSDAVASSDPEEEGSVLMMTTFLSFVLIGQRWLPAWRCQLARAAREPYCRGEIVDLFRGVVTNFVRADPGQVDAAGDIRASRSSLTAMSRPGRAD